MTDGFDGSEFDQAALFGSLDDPAPPLHGGEALAAVMARGSQLRRRRRAAYGIGKPPTPPSRRRPRPT
jgi:hypothetical protein